MKIGLAAALPAALVLVGCQAKVVDFTPVEEFMSSLDFMWGGGDVSDDGPGTHTPGGDRIGPSYKLADDPRVTAAYIELSNAAKARCSKISTADTNAWQGCILEHLAGALRFGAEMAPYCKDERNFPERFYCVMVGSGAADLVEKAKVADPQAFLEAHGYEERESAATAAKMLVRSISGTCPLDYSSHTGCAAREMAALLERSEDEIKACTRFDNDWKDASCVMIGRMAAVYSQSAKRMP